mmetsp:Transcript_45883/g.33642  ORF Transcript_45883/g.33642 Transcript_45883/m.33642 type:complete len:133 (+) Transcript_45883:178-576(+)
MRQKFNVVVKDSLLRKQIYKLVDALEDSTDMINFGRSPYHFPMVNFVFPTRYHIVPIPNLRQDGKDKLPYFLNEQRPSPFMTLNPLKRSALPYEDSLGKDSPREKVDRPHKHLHWRRISHLPSKRHVVKNKS